MKQRYRPQPNRLAPRLWAWACGAAAALGAATACAEGSAPPAPSTPTWGALQPTGAMDIHLPGAPPPPPTRATRAWPELVCPPPPPSLPRPGAPADTGPPWVLPEAGAVAQALRQRALTTTATATAGAGQAAGPAASAGDDPGVSGAPPGTAATPTTATTPPAPALAGLLAWPTDRPLRIGLWGDSHVAAAFFTEGLAAAWGLAPGQIRAAWQSASLGRAGVRLPLRRACVSDGWRHEPAHTAPVGAATGPGLANLVSERAGASLALDLRHPGLGATVPALHLFYQQPAGPVHLSLSANDGPPLAVTLDAPPGPAVLTLRSAQPLALVRLTVQDGPLRLLGWAAVPDAAAPPPAVWLDSWGYPGATAAGWQRAAPESLAAWFGDSGPGAALGPGPYDLVALAYGTNEANAPGFQATAYAAQLRTTVAAWRRQFPRAACLLVAPPDRGVRVRRVSARAPARGAPATPSRPDTPDLLHHALRHAEVARIQAEVAAEAGCAAWSMQAAMGGLGAADHWARQHPAQMATDLVHLTVAGYHRLGRALFQDLGSPQPPGRSLPDPPPAAATAAH